MDRMWERLFFCVTILVLVLRHHANSKLLEYDTGKSLSTYSSNITWFAPFYSGGGYSSEALSFVQALDKVGIEGFTISHHGDSYNPQYAEKLITKDQRMLTKYDILLKTAGYPRISICHSEPGAWYTPHPNYHTSRCPISNDPQNKLSFYKIGRTMFETDRLPTGWLPRLQFMDELWVPTTFMKDIFITSGIPSEKIEVVEEAVNTDFFRPYNRSMINYQYFELPTLREIPANMFIFLFVGKFEDRKGIDILLEAYLNEFSIQRDQTMLLMLTGSYHSSDDFESLVTNVLNKRKIKLNVLSPRYRMLTGIPQLSLSMLYSFAHVLVIPSHGEGWGRPHMEAMSCGTPVIATNWSGPTAFVNDQNGYLLQVEDELVDAPGWEGHKWAQPNVAHLRQLMRHVYTHRDEVKLKGQKARQDMIDKYSLDVMGRKLKDQFDRVLRNIGVLPAVEVAAVQQTEEMMEVSIDAESSLTSSKNLLINNDQDDESVDSEPKLEVET